jgi:hypothetical protein
MAISNPSDCSSRTTRVVRSTSFMAAVSVISNISRCGAMPAALTTLMMLSTRSLRICSGDRFSATLTGFMPAASQRDLVADGLQHPVTDAKICPERSAMGMNSDGAISPSSG